jgi:glycosyltransferase involved in cell wall biosynthesis
VKVLYIVTAYDRHPGDGITPWLVETLHRLHARGVEAEVLAPAYRGSGDAVVDGIRVHRFRYAPARFEDLTHDQTAADRVRERPAYMALVPAYLAAASAKAAALVREYDFDIVHVHWPLPHVIPGWAARRAGDVALVLTFHGVELTFARNSPLPFLTPLLRAAIRSADAVTANSTYTAGLIRKLYDRPVEIVPFGTTLPDPGPPTGPPGDATPGAATGGSGDPGGAELLFVGRLVERKGVHVLLEAMTRLPAPVRLGVIGEGPMGRELEARATELGVADRVDFHGFVSRDTLNRRVAGCDLFVLPAVYDAKGDVEGLGVVLVEALSHARPVVASAAGGIPDIVRDGETGLLVPPGDPEALAASIRRLLEDPELAARLGRAGRAHVESRFSWPGIIDRLVELYERVAH